jgi:hypothetical protein
MAWALEKKTVNTMLKVEYKKKNVAYWLIIDIKGYHVHFRLSSNSPIETSYDGSTIGRNLLVNSSPV